MNKITQYIAGGLAVAGAVIAAAAPAEAGVSIGIGIGPGYFGPRYYGPGPYYYGPGPGAYCDPYSRWYDPYRCDAYDDYDYYNGPVFINGLWLSGGFPSRWYGSHRQFYWHGGWHGGSGFRGGGFHGGGGGGGFHHH